jgi:signal transduction histidine kinase
VRSQLFLGGRSLTGGSGHGLAIARELAERNGGTLRTADVPRGVTFLVEVPLDAASADRIATLYRGREHRTAGS